MPVMFAGMPENCGIPQNYSCIRLLPRNGDVTMVLAFLKVACKTGTE
jgi:hypothetical protein